jgi:hypothetical protein
VRDTTLKRAIKISVVLLAVVYFVAANGMVLQYISEWYSTGGELAIALHSGPTKDLPVRFLSGRKYLPQTCPIVVPSVTLLAHTIVYPAQPPLTYEWVDDSLPLFTTILSSCRADRAPPAA